MEAGSQRPSVDLIVPFVGAAEELSALATRLKHLALGAADTLAIVDNRPPGAPDVEVKGLRVLRAPERQSSYYARNRGAVIGTNAWLVFLDADVEPPTDLIDRYFITAAGERAGVLAGGVVDESLDTHAPRSAAARYTMLRASMSQSNTLGGGRWAYAQTANCAVRRAAFAEVGGFRDDVRSGGDADLCFRLRAAGWEIEPRERAAVVHRSRRTLRRLLRQRARHGSGAAWLDREYPGAFPRARWPGLAKWTAQSFAGAAAARVRGRGDDALVGVVEPLWVWAFEIGRLFPNEVGRR